MAYKIVFDDTVPQYIRDEVNELVNAINNSGFYKGNKTTLLTFDSSLERCSSGLNRISCE